MNVLYVEDSASDADLTLRALRRHAPHMDVAVAPSLADARERLTRAPVPDLVLIDLGLPDGSGLELVADVRRRRLPVAIAVLTGNAAGDSAVAALTAGADDYIVKRDDYLARLPAALELAVARQLAVAAHRANGIRVLVTGDGGEAPAMRRHMAIHAPWIELEVVPDVGAVLDRLVADAAGPPPCDVLLLDCRRIDSGALDLLKALREERHFDLPVVLLTGDADGEAAARALRHSPDQLLVRHPAYLPSLPVVLQAAVDRGRLRREQAALAASEQKYRSLVAAAPGVVYTFRVDAAGRRSFPFMGGALMSALGMSPAEVMADANVAFRRIVPEALPAVEQSIAVSHRALAPWVHEFPFHSAEGKVVWVRGHSRPHREADGATTWHGVFVDVTQHHVAMEALRESEDRYRDLVEHSSDLICTHDLSGRLLSANEAAAQLTGYPRAALLGMNLRELLHPEVQERFGRYLAQIETTGRASGTMRIRTAAGESREWEFRNTLRRDGSGGPVVRGLARDVTERMRAERELRAEKERFERVATHISDALIVDDAEGRVVYANARFGELFGIPDGDLLGVRLEDYVAPEWRAALRERHDRRLRGEAVPAHFEYEGLRRDGGRVWLEVTVTTVMKAGRVVGTQSTVRDVGARRRAEALLRASHAELEHAQAVAHIGSYDLDIATGRWNSSAELDRIFGIDAGYERSVEGWLALVHPGMRERAAAHIAEDVLDRHSQFDMEYRIVRHNDGVVRWVHGLGELEYDDRHQPVRLHGTIQDITTDKIADEAIRLQSAALNATSRAIAITDREGVIVWVNPAFVALTGLAAGEAIGRTHRILNSGRHEPEFYKALWDTILSGQAWNGELTNRRKDGKLYVEHLTITPVTDAAGTITHFVAVKRDLTEQKKLEAQYLRAQRMESVGQLASGVAHDFNNILTAIVGNVEMALARTDLDAGLRDYLDRIARASARAGDLVQQILAISRPPRTVRRVISLGPVLTEAATLLRSTIPSGITITTRVDGDPPPVLADASQIHQVLLNLATNAWHAVEEGPGRIELRLEGVTLHSGDAMPVGARPGRHARIQVRDNGSGMDEVTASRVFEPFFTTRSEARGTGLGLAVVHGIVTAHDGVITVESQPGAGAVFDIYLPGAEEPASAEPPDAPAAPPTGGRNEHVLCVDDETDLVSLMVGVLEAHGYRATGFAVPTEAMEAIRADPARYDLVVTDLSMPGLSGLELARQAHLVRPDLPIVLTSGYVQPDRRDGGHAVGIREVLLKPFRPNELLEVVGRLLPGRTEPRG